jgi:hypothetical protein
VWSADGSIAGYCITPVRLGHAHLHQYCLYASSETTSLSALCLNFIPSYFSCTRTFLLLVHVGLTDSGDVGRYSGRNKAKVGVFNGPEEVQYGLGIGLALRGDSCSTCQELYFQLPAICDNRFWPLNAAEFGCWMSNAAEALCPEADMMPSHRA